MFFVFQGLAQLPALTNQLRRPFLYPVISQGKMQKIMEDLEELFEAAQDRDGSGGCRWL